jgi:hypothetical protein
MFQHALEHVQGNPLWTAITLAMAGRRDEALAIRFTNPVSSFNQAAYYLALGNKNEAFRHLEEAFSEKAPGLVQIRSDPFWAPLRSDSRYRDLLNRIGLPVQ